VVPVEVPNTLALLSLVLLLIHHQMFREILEVAHQHLHMMLLHMVELVVVEQVVLVAMEVVLLQEMVE
jgi:hypothetical protein